MNYLDLLHWSFFASAFLIAVITETLKKFLIQLLPSNKWLHIIIDGRVVPMLLGIIIGLIPGLPLPEMVGKAPGFGTILFFATSGIVSAWLFSLLEKIFSTIEEHLPNDIAKWLGKIFGNNKKEE